MEEVKKARPIIGLDDFSLLKVLARGVLARLCWSGRIGGCVCDENTREGQYYQEESGLVFEAMDLTVRVVV